MLTRILQLKVTNSLETVFVKDTVRRKTKSCDPIKPPKIVIHSLEARLVLNICIPANVSTVNVDANRNEVYDGRAVIQIKHLSKR